MNDYEHKMLEDRENKQIGAGVAFVLFSPGFGIITGAFLSSAVALYVVTAVVAILGIVMIVQAVKARRERKKRGS